MATKRQRVRDLVAFNRVKCVGLHGYISSRELIVTLYNAAIKTGAFDSVHLYNNSNNSVSTLPTGLGVEADSGRVLKVFIGSKVVGVYENKMQLGQLYGSSEKTGDRFFEITKDTHRFYTGALDTLCHSIEWVDRENKRTLVADVIYPNILIMRVLDMSYGSYADVGEKHAANFKMLSYIVKEATQILNCTKREFVGRIIAKRKEKLINLMYDQLTQTADKVRKKIESTEDLILDHKRGIQELEIGLEADRKQLEGYNSLMENLRDKFIKEVDIIKNIKQVTAIDEYSNIDRGIISVDVAGVKIKCQRNWYYLGDYTININISDKTVRFINTSGITRSSHWGANCQHPHCNSDGKPCLGNISTQVMELIGSLDLAFLVNLCISYLQSVNIRDAAGKHIVNWPLCDENGVILCGQNDFGLVSCCVCRSLMPEIENEEWVRCADCGEWVCPTHAKVIETHLCELHICENCFLNYKKCPSCGKYDIKDTFRECPVCGDIVCPECLSNEIQGFAFYSGQMIAYMCKKHHVRKCEGCGLPLVDTASCPSCDWGNFSVGVCAVCGRTIPESLFREDYTDVCVYCDIEDMSKCCVCGRYERNDNLIFDPVTGEHRHHYDCGGELFDIDDIAEPDAGVIELQRRHIENATREYLEVNNIDASDDWVDDAVERIRRQIFTDAMVPEDIMRTDTHNNVDARIQAMLVVMIAETFEDPIVDDTITG